MNEKDTYHHGNNDNHNNHNNQREPGKYRLTLTPSETETMKYYNNNSFHTAHVLLRCYAEMMAPNFRKSRETREEVKVEGEENEALKLPVECVEKRKRTKSCNSCSKSTSLAVKHPPILSRRLGKLKLR